MALRSRLRGLTALVATVALAGGCASASSPQPHSFGATPGGAGASPPSTGTPSSSARSTPPATPPTAPGATAAGSLAPGDPDAVRVEFDPLVAGLSAPVGVSAPADGSGRLFVVEQGGRIRIVRDGRLVTRPFLDLTSLVSSGAERGLLGLAFEPAYGSRGRDHLYVNYTDVNGDTVIAEYRTSTGDPDLGDPSTARLLLHVDQPFANHNGGEVTFGPDGMLYLGLGDGGSGGDPFGNGQSLATHLAKILRVDPTGRGPTVPGTIAPVDNPFAGRARAKPEIWAYGLRNPWRFSFDRATGDLWIGDVGQNAWEEIDLARASEGAGRGLNFGWNRMEGDACFPPGSACDRAGLTLPVAQYGHDEGCAVVGGFVDRAPDAGPLTGTYVYSDNCSGRVWGLASGPKGPGRAVVLNDGGRSISSFGEGADGRLYATDLGAGELLRVVGLAR